MTALILVDSNVILYTLDHREKAKKARCADWLKRVIQTSSITISPQICNEVRNVGVRKLNHPPSEMHIVVRNLLAFCTAPLGAAEVERALGLAETRAVHWWDAVVLASAIGAGCTHLLTEDGFGAEEIAGVRIVNPFVTAPNEVLGAA